MSNFVNVTSILPPIALIVHCIFIFLFKRWLGPIGTFYASLITFSTLITISIYKIYSLLKYSYYEFIDLGRWFYCLDLIDAHLLFCNDTLALVTSVLVLCLTLVSLYFGVEYMSREAFINRLLYLLNLFATSVIFLFYCYDYFLILFAWECIGLFSLLLVNFYSTRIYTTKATMKTFVFSRLSDMFMFFSFLITLNTFNTTDLSLIFLEVPLFSFHYLFFGNYAIHFITLFSFTLVISGSIKAAQFFFHVWLPDAMEAPTPASALIHSSTLVVAGIFLIIRFSILFEFTVFTNYYMAVVGALTLAFGSLTAAFQNDIKKLVAYSTISQIGYLLCGCGFGCYEEVLVYLIVHALNKAFLFILVGYIVHFFSGNTDMRHMGGVYVYSFDITVLLMGVCFNLAGLPYSAGFIAKEFLIFQILRDDFVTLFVRGCWLISFFFTPVYMFKLIYCIMFGLKKSTKQIYSSLWELSSFCFMYLPATGKAATKPVIMSKGPLRFVYRVSFTVMTSQLTSYFLFVFWLFFFFYGESLLLLLLNFTNLFDTINSSLFFNLKLHLIFSIETLPTTSMSNIMSCIQLLTISGFTYLFNLNYICNYNYFLLKCVNAE